MLSSVIRITPLLLLVALWSCGDDGQSSQADATPTSSDAATADTWTNFAEQFFVTYCQDCHGPGDTLRDYSVLSMVKAEQDKIRCGVSATTLANCTISAGMFPVGSGPKPDAAARARLVKWIDDGALE